MTPLRQRFLEDLKLRNYAPRTIETYVRAVAHFARHFKRSPEHLGGEEIRAYQLHLLQRRVSWSMFNQVVCALRLFYGMTLGRPGLVVMIPYGKKPKTLPCVLSAEEVGRLFAAAKPGRNRMLLQTAYALGLRLSELLHLQVGDIDGGRGVVHVRLGKGGKDRFVPIAPRLLKLLRAWWLLHRSKTWLFPGAKPDQPLNAGSVQRLCRKAVTRAGLKKPATMHTLRHSYATHLLEAGVDVVTLQRLLGHASLETTSRYLHLSARRMQNLPSLLDLLALPNRAPATSDMPLSTPPSPPEVRS